MQSQMRLTFENGIKDTEPKVLRPNELVSGEPLTITLGGGSEGVKYYVYGMGELEGIYDRAGYAIQEARRDIGCRYFFGPGLYMGKRETGILHTLRKQKRSGDRKVSRLWKHVNATWNSTTHIRWI